MKRVAQPHTLTRRGYNVEPLELPLIWSQTCNIKRCCFKHEGTLWRKITPSFPEGSRLGRRAQKREGALTKQGPCWRECSGNKPASGGMWHVA